MPLFRSSSGGAGAPVGFRPPASICDDPLATNAATTSALSSASLKRRERTVLYPENSDVTRTSIIEARFSKRAHIEYHQPVKEKPAACDNCLEPAVCTAEVQEGVIHGELSSFQQQKQQAVQLLSSNCVEVEKEVEVEEEAGEVVSRYPVSPHGCLYFQVETDAATRHESTGIIVIQTEELGVMMYDRAGRQFGNRPDPGYPIKQEELDNAKAGMTLKVGSKNVLLITALKEESFRGGEFFLSSEHQLRKKEEKLKAKAEAVAAASKGLTSARFKMTFGQSLCGGIFAQPIFRRRPRDGQCGFTVPLAGRPKAGPGGVQTELRPLHDPNREGAVVLFHAEYKRDAHGRPQVSVVVDPIIGDKLRPHQKAGVKFLFDCITGERMPGYHGAILADEMGLGKTIQTVATIYTCLKQGKRGVPTARKCLVVTPSSLVKNWCNEFDKWLGEGSVKYFCISESTPKGDRIISRFDGEGDVLVISYDQLRKYISRISTLKSVELVVCDEGHRLKNAEVKTTKAVDMLPTRNRVILSGTPIQNDLSEFHAMVGFVNPGILGNRDVFARVFEEPVMQGRDPECPEHLRSLGADRAHYLSNLTQRFILRRTQTINESYLPPKVDVTVFVRLGSLQREAYEKLSQIVEDTSCLPLVVISALRKLCNHMDLFQEAVLNSNKEMNGKGIPKSVLPKGYKLGTLSEAVGSKMHFVSLMLDELRSNGDRDKLVIVSNFTQTLDVIAAMCHRKRVSFFQLDGSMPVKKRQEVVDRFNVPTSQETVFLLSSKAGGVGLNLVGANRLILFDPDWNPANDAQAMGRVWRDGQKKRVFIYRLLSTGSIEEKIYQRQVSKQGLSANVVDMQNDSKQHFTLEELRSLFRFRGDTNSDTHDLLRCTNCEAVAQMSSLAKTKGTEAPMKFRRVGEKKSGPRMDELKGWRHFARCGEFPLDKVVRAISKAAPDLLSFLFADERDKAANNEKGNKNAEKASMATRVQIERPFAQDEDVIICTSQAEEILQESQLEIELHDDDDEEEEEEEDDDE